MIDADIAIKANDYCELWVKLAKQGIMPTEMPAHINDKFNDYVSLGQFYDITRDSKDEKIRAKYDVGVSFLNKYMRETMIEAAIAEEGSEKSKITTATANILKTLSKEIGWDNKDNQIKDDSANFQLQLTVDSEIVAFMTKLGLLQVVNTEKLDKFIVKEYRKQERATNGTNVERRFAGDNPLVKEL